MTRGSLRRRLMVAATAAVAVALVLAALGLERTFARHVERRAASELATHLEQIAAALEVIPSTGALVLRREPSDPRFRGPLSGLYWQVDAGSGAPLLRSRSLWDEELTLPDDVPADGELHRHQITGPGSQHLLVVERSLRLSAPNGARTVRIGVALDGADLDAAARDFTRDLTPYLLVLGGLLVLAAVAAGRIGLAPLGAVQTRLQAIRSGAARQLGQGFPSEVQPLAQELDALLTARETEVARARARAADLAHGLKTPLQVLAGIAERVRAQDQASAEDIDLVVQSLDRQIQRELVRARRAGGQTTARAAIDVVAAQVMAVVQRTPEGRDLAWVTDLAGSLVAVIDPDDLAEALGNLIENAARHATRTVAVRAWREADWVIVTVGDDGPGVAPARLDDVRRRGVRLAAHGRGAGLGLAIVDDVAEAWHGRLELASENGFEARLHLPAAPADPLKDGRPNTT